MRKAVTVLVMLGILGMGAAPAQAATLVVTLALDGVRDIDVPTPDFPGEFKAQQNTWGRVLFNGQLVGYYLFSVQEKMHNGNLNPTAYPNPWISIAIRTVGSPSELLILHGATKPVADGAGTLGGVAIATPGVGFLRFATYTTAVGPGGVTLTFTY